MGLQDSLRQRGYRLTPQRALVLEAVTELGHATPEDVHQWIRERADGVSLSTVYRALELLEGLDLVKHAHLTHGSPTYHPASAAEHVHAVCRSCDAVTPLPPSVVADTLARLRDDIGFEADVSHLTIHGVCRECASSD